MKVVLLKDIRTTRGIYHAGYVLPAVSDGRDGWLTQVAPPRNGRPRTMHLPAGSARPTRNPDWRRDAACTNVGAATFFPETGGPGGIQAREAKQVCSSCPVRIDCAATALDSREKHGVFAGVTMNQPGAREALERIANGHRVAS